MKNEGPTPYYWQCYPVGLPTFVTSFVVLDRVAAMKPFAAVHIAGSEVHNAFDWREDVAPVHGWHWHQGCPLFLSDEKLARRVFEEQYNFFAKHPDCYKIVVGNLYTFSDKSYNIDEAKEAFCVGLSGNDNNEW